jgi:hypothetical protein
MFKGLGTIWGKSHRKPREWNNVHDHLSKNSLSMLFHPSGDLKESYKWCVEFGSAKLPNQKYAQHCPILDSYPGWDLWGVKETKGWQDNFCMQFVFSPWGFSLYFGIVMHFKKIDKLMLYFSKISGILFLKHLKPNLLYIYGSRWVCIINRRSKLKILTFTILKVKCL